MYLFKMVYRFKYGRSFDYDYTIRAASKEEAVKQFNFDNDESRARGAKNYRVLKRVVQLTF